MLPMLEMSREPRHSKRVRLQGERRLQGHCALHRLGHQIYTEPHGGGLGTKSSLEKSHQKLFWTIHP